MDRVAHNLNHFCQHFSILTKCESVCFCGGITSLLGPESKPMAVPLRLATTSHFIGPMKYSVH